MRGFARDRKYARYAAAHESTALAQGAYVPRSRSTPRDLSPASFEGRNIHPVSESVPFWFPKLFIVDLTTDAFICKKSNEEPPKN